ncbi:MAG: family 43 glycosylhydrolase [Anaerolineae bacterium]|nr:family 43 glycosylhydrolase [Anaerolineae bacterium]
MLQLPERWLWDFWFARDGLDYHLFYLQASSHLEHPDLRHWNVSIGHAVSQDLRNWSVLPDALHPAADDPQAFDSFTTWTGSVIRHDGLWYMFYTGASRRAEDQNGLVQRVGLATSPDLLRWTKHPANPLIVADPARYELLDRSLWHDQAWRDPCVIRHTDGRFYAFITARVNNGPADGRGVIALAQSNDLMAWEVREPVTLDGDFGQMEVPQVLEIGGRWYLLFCTAAQHHSAARRARIRPEQVVTGTHYLVADNPLGPYRSITDDFLCGDARGSLYSGKLIQDPAGDWKFMAFHNTAPDGSFIGAISDPLPVRVEADGRLVLS